MSDLKIGFANKFFTLWSVRSETIYKTNPYDGNAYPAGTETRYTYLQNLSLDLAKAQAKAKAKGATDLTPDEELRGKSSSWVDYVPNPALEVPDHIFKVGKYRGEDIRENTDIDYLFWYAKNVISGEAVKRLLSLSNDYKFFEGEIYPAETVKGIKRIRRARKKALKLGYVEGTMERNINDYGFELAGVEILVGLLPLKSFYYHDFRYYLPVIDGKAKRVKGKEVKVYVTPEEGGDLRATKLELI